MSTKTFDVFISVSSLSNLGKNTSAVVYPLGGDLTPIKAKLIVELPERTGTITESDFNLARATDRKCMVEEIRERVFGKEQT